MNNYKDNLETSDALNDVYSWYGSVLTEDEDPFPLQFPTIIGNRPFTLCSEEDVLGFYVTNMHL